LSPPIPESLQEWADILNHPEWQQRLLWCNGTNNRFLDVPEDTLTSRIIARMGLEPVATTHHGDARLHQIK